MQGNRTFRNLAEPRVGIQLKGGQVASVDGDLQLLAHPLANVPDRLDDQASPPAAAARLRTHAEIAELPHADRFELGQQEHPDQRVVASIADAAPIYRRLPPTELCARAGRKL